MGLGALGTELLYSVQVESRATSGLLHDLLMLGGQSWAWVKASPRAPGHALPGGAGSGCLPGGLLDSLRARSCGKDSWGSGVLGPS